MAKTLRVRTRAGWVTKAPEPLPQNRITSAEADDNLLALEDAILATAFRTPVGLSITSQNLVTETTHAHSVDFPVTSVAGKTGDVILNRGDVGLSNVDNKSSSQILAEISPTDVVLGLGYSPEDAANKNMPGGYAGLDSNSKINPAQLPALAITDTFVVANQAEMLALDVQRGDVAIRTDVSRTFILRTTPASTLENWQEVLAPLDVVQSVNGFVGTVVLPSITAGAYLVGTPYNGTLARTWSVNASTSADPNTIVARDSNGDITVNNIVGAVTGNSTSANQLSSARLIGLSGDATGSAPFNGTANATIPVTLVDSGVSASTYGSSVGVATVTVNSKGIITSASTTAIRSATLAQTGIAQLENSVSSTSTTTAAVPASVKSANDNANTRLPLDGGTLTGTLTLAGAPTAALHAATKAYVDSMSSNAGTEAKWGNISGTLTAQTDLVAYVANASNLTTGIVPNGRLSGAYSGLGALTPAANGVSDLGGPILKWNTIYANVFNGVATSARYADVAERYATDTPVVPGDVVVFGGLAEITVTNQHTDSRVAGVISTNPAHLMNADAGDDLTHPPVALLGRVPCRVVGLVRPGDIMVTSMIPGVAVALRPCDPWKPGAMVGKALGHYNSETPGTIEICVGRA